MRELAIITFQTLDGVMQAPSAPDEDPSGGFTSGGWAAPYWEAVMGQVMREAMAQPYDILFGRKTYETFAGHWPNESDENPVARMMNDARKYVITSTLTEFAWNNTQSLAGDAAVEVVRLKAQDGPLIQVHGSAELIQTLVAHDLIDEYRLWTFPVVVGGGKRLFADGSGLTDLALRKTDVTENGVVMSIYRRAE
ncbi:MAG: dihydrofolate reductase family protein [Pseudomonadota bacterium]